MTRLDEDGAVQAAIAAVRDLYHRLVILTGPPAPGDVTALATKLGCKKVDLSLELSSRLMGLSDKQRRLRAAPLVEDAVAAGGELVLLDRIEILFTPSLEVDPLKCLQTASRSLTLVVVWPGTLEQSVAGARFLAWAPPGHAEHRRISTEGLTIVSSKV